ncbi:MAG: radical SAM family heme chaperone HemW [Prevotella sp.]|nr:radical SAM family heme chaperone HemW [Prevotella sp.]MEE0337466.1 radical SAM family heme chaperone HemW [Prevotella sp.]
MSGLYIHIPFCASRCIYCAFYSTVKHGQRSAYIDSLIHEMQLRTDFLPQGNDATINTIYIGGGTPSQISRTDIDRLFNNIYKVYGCKISETTVEVNPDDVDANLVRCLVNNGVNRVSMGAQTFDDERLSWLHRRHSSKQVYEAVDCLRHGGIARISVDLMYGFPNQTAEQWQYDIDEVIKLGVEHVSAYSLMYEEGTPLYRLLEKHEIKENDEELSLSMYNTLVEQFRAAGYEHYEVSNFALPGCRAQHNSSYWNDTPYIGLGAAAHSYNRSVRQWNVSDIDAYMEAINEGRVPFEQESIDADTHYDDLVTTALRTSDGLDLTILSAQHQDYLLKMAQPYLLAKRMERKGNRIRICEDSFMISDMIMSDLMMVY